MARKKNPSTLTKVLIGTAAVLGGYGLFKVVTYKKAKPALKQAQTPEALCAAAYPVGSAQYTKCVADAKGEQTKEKAQKKAGKYVGAGWTDWPHKDVFKDEASFGDTLLALGYALSGKWDTPEWSIRGPIEIDAIKEFQGDWNTMLTYGQSVLAEYFGGFVQVIPLTKDGKIGTNTVNAMFRALAMSEDKEWRDLVDEVKKSKAEA